MLTVENFSLTVENFWQQAAPTALAPATPTQANLLKSQYLWTSKSPCIGPLKVENLWPHMHIYIYAYTHTHTHTHTHTASDSDAANAQF